jgi:PAS domain S-box-containing protein
LDAQGKLEEIIHMATDITELKRVQTELQQANARFYALVEGIPDIVYLKDAEGRNLYVNKAYENFAGATRDRIVGKKDGEIMPPDLAMQCTASDARVFEQGTSIRIEESTTDKNGNLIWYETIKNPIRDTTGKIIGLVGVSRDVTERKRAEVLIREYSEHLEQLVEARTRELREAQEQLLRQERLATLGQLAGSIAHELRSPLSAIKNAAYYLRMQLRSLDDETREMVQILDEQVDVSARIIESLLDFARPKTPILKRVHLPYVIQAALEQCRIPNHITLDWQVAPDLPDMLVDAAQMQIVFRNIINNAVQAMPNGGKLTIGVNVEGETMVATFSDTGHGIPPDALEKIFQPLYTTKAKGIGLGLALCKLIVEAHNGKISATSTVGKGSTFTVALPLDR